MNEEINLEELLNVIAAVAEGLDKQSVPDIKALAEKVRTEQNYNQAKALEHSVLDIFNKIYAQCQDNKNLPNYDINGGCICIDNDFKMSVESCNCTTLVAQIRYPSVDDKNIIFNLGIDYNVWNYLVTYIRHELINNKFDKIKFVSDMLKISTKKGLPFNSVDEIAKYFPME